MWWCYWMMIATYELQYWLIMVWKEYLYDDKWRLWQCSKTKKCGKSLLAGQNLGALQCSDLHCAQLHLSGGSAWTQCFVMTQWQKQSQPYTIESPFSTSNWMWNNKRVTFLDVHLLHDHLVKHKCGYLCKVLKNGTCKFYNVNDVRHFNVPFSHYVDDLLFILPAWPPG